MLLILILKLKLILKLILILKLKSSRTDKECYDYVTAATELFLHQSHFLHLYLLLYPSILFTKLFFFFVFFFLQLLQSLFKRARAAAPSLIFFDEIDALAGKRLVMLDSSRLC